MSDSSISGWKWLLDLAVAVGTLGAVIVALFGQAFRSKFFPPKLSLSFPDLLGEKAQVKTIPPEGSIMPERVEDEDDLHPCSQPGTVWLRNPVDVL